MVLRLSKPFGFPFRPISQPKKSLPYACLRCIHFLFVSVYHARSKQNQAMIPKFEPKKKEDKSHLNQ